MITATATASQRPSLAGAVTMIVKCGRVGTIGRPADQHEAAITITAIDITVLINLQKYAGMAKRCGDPAMRPVASDSGRGDARHFGGRDHAERDSNSVRWRQSALGVQPRAAYSR